MLKVRTGSEVVGTVVFDSRETRENGGACNKIRFVVGCLAGRKIPVAGPVKYVVGLFISTVEWTHKS